MWLTSSCARRAPIPAALDIKFRAPVGASTERVPSTFCTIYPSWDHSRASRCYCAMIATLCHLSASYIAFCSKKLALYSSRVKVSFVVVLPLLRNLRNRLNNCFQAVLFGVVGAKVDYYIMIGVKLKYILTDWVTLNNNLSWLSTRRVQQ